MLPHLLRGLSVRMLPCLPAALTVPSASVCKNDCTLLGLGVELGTAEEPEAGCHGGVGADVGAPIELGAAEELEADFHGGVGVDVGAGIATAVKRGAAATCWLGMDKEALRNCSDLSACFSALCLLRIDHGGSDIFLCTESWTHGVP